MTRKIRFLQRLAVVAVLGAAECAGVAALGLALGEPAMAQDYPFLSRQRPARGDGFFQQLFGTPNRRQDDRDIQQQAPADNSRAPAARKLDPKADQVAPTTSVMVLGDGMADWLAYGLEDAFADAPEVGIVRRNKIHSGLIRYDVKGDLDWWHVARDILGAEKPDYVVMMLGVSDRQNIREKDVAKESDKKESDKKEADKKEAAKKDADKKSDAKNVATKDPANKDQADKDAANKDAPAADKNAMTKEADDDEQPSIAAPEPAPGKRANGVIEFRGDAWEKIYNRRIDETVAALKSKGVPVFWVGLPSIRGTKSTADVVYLNDLYRARAEKAGAVYIDVWDGFVDETSKFSTFGPDYEGQVRRLRSADGVYFTKYGARKLAHYVEREIRRYMSNRSLQVSLPTSPAAPVPGESKSTARPLAGPVVPLTVTPGNSEELAGGVAAQVDATATRVLTKGEPLPAPAGRADDFVWPRGSERPLAAVAPTAATASASVAPAAVAPQAAPTNGPTDLVFEPEKTEKKPEPKTPKTAQAGQPKPKSQGATGNAPRPPAPIRPASGSPLSGWFR